MFIGAALLVLMVIRIIMRFTTKKPDWADTGHKFLNWLGELVHWGMYLVIFFLFSMGGWLAHSRNVLGYLLNSEAVIRGARLPNALHHLGWFMIILLLGLHIAGALYHQFILKDNLLARMWYGKR